MIQWIIVALILVATLLAIVRHFRRRPGRCDASCADCPLSQNCNKNEKR